MTPSPRLPSEAPFPEFEYLWEVRSYDPPGRRLDCRIHFSVPDAKVPGGIREVRDAFSYDWRVWSVYELMESCVDAGFADVQVWRHTYDPAKGAAGVFLGRVNPDSLLELDNWNAYVVACG